MENDPINIEAYSRLMERLATAGYISDSVAVQKQTVEVAWTPRGHALKLEFQRIFPNPNDHLITEEIPLLGALLVNRRVDQ